MFNIANITHKDLDGAICALLVKILYPKVETFFCEYSDVDVLCKMHDENNIFVYITDIAPEEETFKSITNSKNFRIYDHHPKSEWLLKYDQIYDDTVCGALLYYNKFVNSINAKLDSSQKEVLFNIVRLTNDWDKWIHSEPEAKQLQGLFEILGPEEFLQTMLKNLEFNEIMTSTQKEWVACATYRKEKLKKFWEKNHTLYTTQKERYAIIYESDHVSEICDHILKKVPKISAAMYVDLKRKKVGIRSLPNKNGLAREVALLNNGGGHPDAAGFPLTFSTPEFIYDFNYV